MQLRKESLKKNSGLYGIQTLDLCDTGAALHRYRRSKGSNPVQAWIFFLRLSFRNCKSCVYRGPKVSFRDFTTRIPVPYRILLSSFISHMGRKTKPFNSQLRCPVPLKITRVSTVGRRGLTF